VIGYKFENHILKEASDSRGFQCLVSLMVGIISERLFENYQTASKSGKCKVAINLLQATDVKGGSPVRLVV